MTEQYSQSALPGEASAQTGCEPLQKSLELMMLGDDVFASKLETFVDEEIAQRSGGDVPKLPLFDTKNQTTFIPPNQEVTLDSNESAVLRFNDPEAYKTMLTSVYMSYAKLRKTHGDGIDTLFSAAINGVNSGQAKYFESIVPSDESRRERAAMLGDIMDEYSVRDMKGRALCGERAIVCHNVLKMLGFDSAVKVGKLEAYDTDGLLVKDEPHAFLVVRKPDGGSYAYDPMNPRMTWSEDKKTVLAANPNVFLLPEEGLVQASIGIKTKLPDGTTETVTKGKNVYVADFSKGATIPGFVIASAGINT